jgi:hypothetical protein
LPDAAFFQDQVTCLDCTLMKKSVRNGFAKAARILHHVRWQHPLGLETNLYWLLGTSVQKETDLASLSFVFLVTFLGQMCQARCLCEAEKRM